jgi:thiamine transport system substrate-binding protein
MTNRPLRMTGIASVLAVGLLAASCGSSAKTTTTSALTTIVATSAAATTGVGTTAPSTSTATTTSTTATPVTTGPPTTSQPVTLTLVTHDSFAVTDSVLAAFTKQTGIKVDVPKGAGDAGLVLNRAILTKGKPEGDVLWGVDNTLLSRAVKSGVFVPYAASGLGALDPTATALVPGHELTPVDSGDVCVNYDKAWFAKKKLAPPATLADLTKPEYKNLLVVENPATSSTGLAFLLATVARYGTDGWPAYWKQLRANGVKVADGWTEAYSTDFSGSSGKGPKPLVVSYASSPPAEIVFATDPKPTEPSTASFTDGCFRQIEFAGVLAGTRHEAEARQLIDFLVGTTFQEDMPLQMFVSPINPAAAVPDVYAKFTAVPPAPLSVTPADIDAHRDEWIKQWTEVVLR